MKFSLTCLFLSFAFSMFAQDNPIKGRVVGQQMENVPYARITNTRTHQEVETDTGGFYYINASTGDTLTYKSIGYTQEKREVNDITKHLNVLLINKTVNDLGAVWTRRQWRKAERSVEKYYKQLERQADQSGKWKY